MKKIPDGYQNEFLFVLAFNNKKVKELNPLLRQVIDESFYDISDEAIIKSWRNHNSYEKADILIKIDDYVRSISIKKGSRNSVHAESIESFKEFLRELEVKEKIIYYYELFHYGVSFRNFNKVLSSKEYVKKNKRKIKKVNEALKKVEIDKLIDRFILLGNNSKYRVAGIIDGTPDDFVWITREDIVTSIKNNINRESSSVHIGPLFIQPMNRCINENKKYLWCRDIVQIKWYSLFDDIIINMNNKVNR